MVDFNGSKFNFISLSIIRKLGFWILLYSISIGLFSYTRPAPLNEKISEVITFESDLVNQILSVLNLFFNDLRLSFIVSLLFSAVFL